MFSRILRQITFLCSTGKKKGGEKVQVLCVPTEECGEIVCSICGNQYKLYFERPSWEDREQAIAEVLQVLAEHHVDHETGEAHPEKPFTVPEWSGRPELSAAALLGGAPLPF
jgi:GTPase SAR1 family protein